ncbi:MAG TPA: 50S ribosomal protein L17 [Bacteroidetes bacterium]|nr:MAG: 50S ribosomal protein L17 [Rhodothermaceae bacterium TMED105]HBD42635.1 50S ribosomal protein L17 [Bacteroidota bacterium]|tara:strand:- start:1123 stop:1848 length:726 start_codon:yes stop_codon:yes gene_type:complete
MRHLVRGRKLGRSKAHRKATMQALCVALVREKRIQTTVAKAKELRRYIEPLVTRAKVDSQHNRRLVFGELQDKLATQELFDTIGPKVGDRPGGYTRVLKTGFRGGDAAEMALIELIDFNESEDSSSAKPKRSRRSRRGGGSTAAKSTEAPVAAKEEAPVAEEVVEADEAPVAQVEVEATQEQEAAEADVTEAKAEDAEDASTDEAPAAQEEVEDEPKASEEPTAETPSDEPTDSDEEKKDA